MKASVPAELLVCADEPAPPVPGMDDRVVAAYFREAIDAGRDCRVVVRCMRAFAEADLSSKAKADKGLEALKRCTAGGGGVTRQAPG